MERNYNKTHGLPNATKSRTEPASTSAAAYSYTVTPAQQVAVRDGYLAKLAQKNPALAARLQPQLTRYSYESIYASILSGTGLNNNNLADALTVYTVQSWMVVNRQAIDPSAAQLMAVRQQWVRALAKSQLAGDANTCRQLAEEYKMRTVLQNAGWKDAVKTNAVNEFAAVVDKNTRAEFKLNMGSMAITKDGFRAR